MSICGPYHDFSNRGLYKDFVSLIPATSKSTFYLFLFEFQKSLWIYWLNKPKFCGRTKALRFWRDSNRHLGLGVPLRFERPLLWWGGGGMGMRSNQNIFGKGAERPSLYIEVCQSPPPPYPWCMTYSIKLNKPASTFVVHIIAGSGEGGENASELKY